MVHQCMIKSVRILEVSLLMCINFNIVFKTTTCAFVAE